MLFAVGSPPFWHALGGDGVGATGITVVSFRSIGGYGRRTVDAGHRAAPLDVEAGVVAHVKLEAQDLNQITVDMGRTTVPRRDTRSGTRGSRNGSRSLRARRRSPRTPNRRLWALLIRLFHGSTSISAPRLHV